MGRSVLQRLVLPALRASSSCRRCPLLLFCLSGLYLFFVVSQVGHTQLQHRDQEPQRERLRLLDHLDPPGPGPGGSAAPTRSNNNVVYITLRSRRLKPANIRGTIRPKLRRKVRSSQNQPRGAERRSGAALRNFTQQQKLWSEAGEEDYRPVEVKHDAAGAQSSSIRIYSQRPPPWLSPQDVELMRFLADSRVLRVQSVSAPGGSAEQLLFQGEEVRRRQEEAKRGQEEQPGSRTCRGRCGLISSPGDSSQVFAFHLDRVLGLNRTLPTVCRRFRLIHEGQPCPVASWDASLYPEGLAAGWSTVRLTWGEYQSSLKQRCWHRNISPKPDSGCSSVHHYEWSKLALFDFLLQIHSRLDQSCCGFRPRQEDECVELGLHAGCGDQNHIHLSNIVHRGHDPRRLVFTSNKGFFDRNEDNLDFRLLEGIRELPEAAVSVLQSRRLRERLLQSLFLDQTYWESQGGRQGIDKLIDVIESRAKVLLTYINAHGIKVTAMNV